MKITRYFQSCLLVEDNGVRLLLDPSGSEKERLQQFRKLDAVFYTHEHSDHFDASLAQTFIEQAIAPVYANTSTVKQIKGSATEVKNGQEFDIKGLKIKAIELPHCPMWDGSEGPQNTGYLINGRLFDPGDGKELQGLSVENLALPITGPDISLRDAFDFLKQLTAQRVIPVHYDYIGTKPEVFASVVGSAAEVRVLGIGESTEL